MKNLVVKEEYQFVTSISVMIYQKQDIYDKAIEYYNKALYLFKELGNTKRNI